MRGNSCPKHCKPQGGVRGALRYLQVGRAFTRLLAALLSFLISKGLIPRSSASFKQKDSKLYLVSLLRGSSFSSIFVQFIIYPLKSKVAFFCTVCDCSCSYKF